MPTVIALPDSPRNANGTARHLVERPINEISQGGAKIAQLQRETKCRITLNREDRSRVVLRGTRTALAAAREHIAALVATYARENQSVDCPDDLANVLIARAGHMAKMVEKEHGVRCRVDRTGNKLRISGPEANVVAAKAAIAEIRTQCCEETLAGVSADEIGMVIGKSGATIRRLTKAHACEIAVKRDEGAIVFSGLREPVDAALAEVRGLVDKYRRENIVVEVMLTGHSVR